MGAPGASLLGTWETTDFNAPEAGYDGHDQSPETPMSPVSILDLCQIANSLIVRKSVLNSRPAFPEVHSLSANRMSVGPASQHSKERLGTTGHPRDVLSSRIEAQPKQLPIRAKKQAK
jgi:hypothetical protein